MVDTLARCPISNQRRLRVMNERLTRSGSGGGHRHQYTTFLCTYCAVHWSTFRRPIIGKALAKISNVSSQIIKHLLAMIREPNRQIQLLNAIANYVSNWLCHVLWLVLCEIILNVHVSPTWLRLFHYMTIGYSRTVLECRSYRGYIANS